MPTLPINWINALRRGGDPYAALRELYGDWPVDMMISYIDINNHNTFSDIQKDLIASRLDESYVETTFGPTGLNKTACDFFLFFENSNTTTALTTKTNTKTGATLRWNYGDGNVYSQNNLPGEICNGVVTVTSSDGFTAWSRVYLDDNTWINYLPNFEYFTGLLRVYAYDCTFSGNMPSFRSNSLVEILYFNDNLFTNTSLSFAGLSKLKNLFLTSLFTLPEQGIPDLTGCDSLAYLKLGSVLVGEYMPFMGRIPDVGGAWDYLACYNAKITGVDITTFDPGMVQIDLRDCLMGTSEIGGLLSRLNTYYSSNAPSGNIAIKLEGFGNGAITGDETNTDLIALKAAYVSAGYVCTVTYNADAERFATDGKLVISHDDMRVSAYSKALQLLNDRSLPATFCCVSDWMETTGFCTWAQVKEIQDDSHEIASHSKTHQSLSGLSDAELRVEFDGVASAFAANDINVAATLAYPYGANDALTRSVAAEYYTGARTASSGFVIPSTDKFILDVKNIDTTPPSELQSVKDWVLRVKYGQVFGVFLFHDVVDSGATGSQINKSDLEAILDYVVESGIDVILMKDIIPLMD